MKCIDHDASGVLCLHWALDRKLTQAEGKPQVVPSDSPPRAIGPIPPSLSLSLAL